MCMRTIYWENWTGAVYICAIIGSFTGQLLDYEDMDERLESDVERLASELDNRLCLETNSSDGDADDDDDDDDDEEFNLPPQVFTIYIYFVIFSANHITQKSI